MIFCPDCESDERLEEIYVDGFHWLRCSLCGFAVLDV